MNRWRDLQPAEPVVRYERKTPGELIHIDIKKLGKFAQTGHRITDDRTVKSRGIGWEFVHVCATIIRGWASVRCCKASVRRTRWRFYVQLLRGTANWASGSRA